MLERWWRVKNGSNLCTNWPRSRLDSSQHVRVPSRAPLTRARITQEYCFFAVTSVTPLPGWRKNKLQKRWNSSNETPLFCCHQIRKARRIFTVTWNSSSSQVRMLKNNDLEGMCDRCDSKKHKTLVHIRVRARGREPNFSPISLRLRKTY